MVIHLHFQLLFSLTLFFYSWVEALRFPQEFYCILLRKLHQLNELILNGLRLVF